MTIASIAQSRQADRPLRVVVYGNSGVGKSTFAAAAPNPVFLLGEDGAGFLSVPAFPRPLYWADVLEAVQELTDMETPYQSLVIDTADGIEPLCVEHVCRVGGKKNLEDFGFGKGQILALEEWRKLLLKLEALQAKRRMNVIILAHAVAREFKDPDYESSWKRWTLNLSTKIAELTASWTDALLFATHEAVTKKDGFKVRGYATGERLLYTTWAGSRDGKNRYNLPPVLSLDWATFWEAAKPALRPGALAPVELSEADARQLATLETDAGVLIAQLPSERQPKAREAVEAAVKGRDLPRLKGLVRKLKEALDASSVTSAPDHNAA